jgi:hypothetical protein
VGFIPEEGWIQMMSLEIPIAMKEKENISHDDMGKDN